MHIRTLRYDFAPYIHYYRNKYSDMDFDIFDLYKLHFLHIRRLFYILVYKMGQILSYLEDMSI